MKDTNNVPSDENVDEKSKESNGSNSIHVGYELNEFVDSKVQLWTLLSFVAIFFGYIGFSYFCYENQIPFELPGFEVVIPIGFYILCYLGMMYFFATESNDGSAGSAFAIVLILFYATENYPLLASASLLFMMLYSKVIFSKDITKTNTALNGFNINNYSIVWWVLMMLCGVLVSIKLMAIYVFTFYLMKELSFIKINKLVYGYHVILFVVILPLATMGSFINDANKTLVGISKRTVVLYSKSDTIRGLLIYQNDSRFFMKSNVDTDTTVSIQKSSIIKIESSNARPARKLDGIFFLLKAIISPDRNEIGKGGRRDALEKESGPSLMDDDSLNQNLPNKN